MGNKKNKKKKKNNDRVNRYNLKGVPKDVEEFAFATFEEYWDENKDQYSKKKEARHDFYWTLLEYLPVVVDFMCAKGHMNTGDIQEAKKLVYDKFVNSNDKDRFVLFLTKYVEDEGNDIENIIFLPILLREIIMGIIHFNETKSDDLPPMDSPEKFFNLSNAIMKKGMKKMKKAGVDKSLAFELLSVMPHPAAIKYSPYFRVKEIFDILYKFGETTDFEFRKIVKILFNEESYNYLIGFALQEKKEKMKGFNERQQALWSSITKWTFNTLEDMTDREIKDILKNYISLRKRDASAGKDAVRRFYISSLSEDEYPNICKVVENIKRNDQEAEKYL